MGLILINHLGGFLAAVRGQGTFLYDQQSATESSGGGSTHVIQDNEPLGQSFAPQLSSVGFIRLALADRNPATLGATMHINLRSNSITGSLLGSTDPVFMPNNFGSIGYGYTNFFFPIPIPVVPGTTYYFETVVDSGEPWSIVAYNYSYAGGTWFLRGSAVPQGDLWFREGIVVPEPSTAVLGLVGAALFMCLRRAKRIL
jgi:hypothetical protein